MTPEQWADRLIEDYFERGKDAVIAHVISIIAGEEGVPVPQYPRVFVGDRQFRDEFIASFEKNQARMSHILNGETE